METALKLNPPIRPIKKRCNSINCYPGSKPQLPSAMLKPIKKLTTVHYLILGLIFLIGLLLRMLYVQPIINDTYIARDAKHYVDYG